MNAKFVSLAGALIGALGLMSTGCAENISTDRLAAKIEKPADVHFFGDHAVYMGDKDGYRYVHVRDIFDPWGAFGECTYKVAESDWPMDHPMRLTCDATKWKDVEWLDGDRPPGVPQNVDLYISPSFPEGAPKTQPTTMASTNSAPGAVDTTTNPTTGPGEQK